VLSNAFFVVFRQNDRIYRDVLEMGANSAGFCSGLLKDCKVHGFSG